MTKTCGTCTLCCTLMGVSDLPERKWPENRCKHECAAGCSIYNARPESCSKFECMYLQGSLPEEYRPDRVGYLAYVEEDDNRSVRVLIPSKLDQTWTKNRKLIELITALAHDHKVYVSSRRGLAATWPGASRVYTMKGSPEFFSLGGSLSNNGLMQRASDMARAAR